jgi:hypothetical protein
VQSTSVASLVARAHASPQHCSMIANTHEILYTSTGRPAYPPGCAGLRAIMGNWSTDITPIGMCTASHDSARAFLLLIPTFTHEYRLTSPGLREALSIHDPLPEGR